MQLLEQLAMGRCTNSTLESITTEYASICGYVECMSELCESEVLFEGISVKDIVKAVCDVIIGLFGKIKKLGMKVISFLKSKISWFTARGKNYSNNKFEEDLKNQETKSEKIKDILNKNPYTGPHPNGIIDGLFNIKQFVTYGIETDVKYCDIGLEMINDVLSGERTFSANFKEEYENFFSNPSKESYDDIVERFSSLKGVLNGPSDIPKALEILYKDGFSDGLYCDKKVLGRDDIRWFSEDIAKVSSDIASMLQNMITTFQRNVDYCNKKSTEVEAIMKKFDSSANEEYDDFLQKYMIYVMNKFTIAANMNASSLAAIPNILNVATKDVETVQTYLKFIKAKIDSV